MVIQKTETQRAIESYESKKAKLQAEITGMTDCKNAINAAATKTAYMNAQIAFYDDKIAEYQSQIIEIDGLVTKLNA